MPFTTITKQIQAWKGPGLKVLAPRPRSQESAWPWPLALGNRGESLPPRAGAAVRLYAQGVREKQSDARASLGGEMGTDGYALQGIPLVWPPGPKL